MAKAQTYIKDIRAQVRADHGGKVPDHLNLTIRNYAAALELRDKYRDEILADGVSIIETGSMGQSVRRQHPLRRPCDNRWNAWMELPGRKLGISNISYIQCRIPYEQGQQLQIKFHK